MILKFLCHSTYRHRLNATEYSCTGCNTGSKNQLEYYPLVLFSCTSTFFLFIFIQKLSILLFLSYTANFSTLHFSFSFATFFCVYSNRRSRLLFAHFILASASSVALRHYFIKRKQFNFQSACIQYWEVAFLPHWCAHRHGIAL